MQKLFVAGLFLFVFVTARAQITVNGSTCAAQGVEYQYTISNGQDSSTSVQVCITGGVIAGTSDSCKTDSAFFNVHVIWNTGGTSSGAINVTIGSNTAVLNVTITSPLSGGVIDSASKVQFIDSSTVPVSITCPVASGGACSSSFSYQWQQSADNLTWTDIDSATNQNLAFSVPASTSAYYRRKTTETVSGSISYSDIAAVFLNPSPGAFNRLKMENRSIENKDRFVQIVRKGLKLKHA